jgi:beta-lactamase regulating signal transducer with metallopeptidase domain
MLTWSHETLIAALGASLLHSLWQGAVIGGIGLLSGARLKRVPPDVRHGVYCLLLLTLFVVWLAGLACLYLTLGRSMPVVFHVTGTVLSRMQVGSVTLPPAHRASMDLLWACSPYLVGLWALGVGLLCVRHIGSLLVLHHLRHAGTSPCPPEWHERIRCLAARLGLRRAPVVRLSVHADVPFTFGLFKSYVLIPPSALMGLAPNQLEALLAHELAHIRRNDALINLVQVCVETALFYHPVVWWLSAQIRAAREQQCDDLAVEAVGDRTLYARALVSMEELRASIPHLALAANGGPLKMTRSSLVYRIRRVLNVTTPEQRAPWTAGAIALCAVTIGLATLWPVQARSATPLPTRSAPAVEQPVAQDQPTTQKTVLKLNVNGTSYTLHTFDLSPDTNVDVDGTTRRFSDLSAEAQDALREAVKDAQEAPKDTVGTTNERRMVIKVNGKTYELNTFNLTPDTSIKLNGAAVRFGDMTAQEQETVRQAVENARSAQAEGGAEAGAHIETTVKATRTPSGVKRFVTKRIRQKVYMFKMGADTATVYGDLKPDTIVAINGMKSKFKALPASRQKQIQEAWSHVSKTDR